MMSDAVTLEREIDVSFEKIPEPFYINEQAEVSIEVKRYKDVLKVSLNVLVQINGTWGVWTLKDDHAHFLKLKDKIQNSREVSAANLTKTMQIIVPDGKKKPLKEGMNIHL